MLEDTFKNLKNGSDSLKYLISRYKFVSYNTFKKVKNLLHSNNPNNYDTCCIFRCYT
ncbi:hypothetical protein BDF21DRAFT_405778 [Thamnidium elegans]|nr:hypothetical protein BDF21DRAFT_405778 [Thamnidium elegans]